MSSKIIQSASAKPGCPAETPSKQFSERGLSEGRMGARLEIIEGDSKSSITLKVGQEYRWVQSESVHDITIRLSAAGPDIQMSVKEARRIIAAHVENIKEAIENNAGYNEESKKEILQYSERESTILEALGTIRGSIGDTKLTLAMNRALVTLSKKSCFESVRQTANDLVNTP